MHIVYLLICQLCCFRGNLKIEDREGTRPRKYYLIAAGSCLLVAGLTLFFGWWFSPSDAWFPLKDGNAKISVEAKDIMATFFTDLRLFDTLACAIYWDHLRRRSLSLKYGKYRDPSRPVQNLVKGVFNPSPDQSCFSLPALKLAALFTILYIFFKILAITSVIEGLSVFLFFFFCVVGVDILVSIVLIYQVRSFVSEIQTLIANTSKVDPPTSSKPSHYNNSDNATRMSKCFHAMLLLDPRTYDDLQLIRESDEMARSTINLTIHLSKWLLLFTVFAILDAALLIALFKEDRILTGRPQDYDSCSWIVLPNAGFACFGLAWLCKVIGMCGPKIIPATVSTDTNDIETDKNHFEDDRMNLNYGKAEISGTISHVDGHQKPGQE